MRNNGFVSFSEPTPLNRPTTDEARWKSSPAALRVELRDETGGAKPVPASKVELVAAPLAVAARLRPAAHACASGCAAGFSGSGGVMAAETPDLDAARAALERSVRSGPGVLDATVRAQAMDDPDALGGALGLYAGQVALDANGIDDAHIDALRAAGLDDRAIFELTAAAAVGKAGKLLDAALRALDEPV
ncbi:MAG: hypothetical protein RIT45_3561 [Pseudomonadota bacterium]